LVAYLARYAATLVSVTSPPPVSRTTRGSIWAPKVISQPLGFTGCETVAGDEHAGIEPIPEHAGVRAEGGGWQLLPHMGGGGCPVRSGIVRDAAR